MRINLNTPAKYPSAQKWLHYSTTTMLASFKSKSSHLVKQLTPDKTRNQQYQTSQSVLPSPIAATGPHSNNLISRLSQSSAPLFQPSHQHFSPSIHQDHPRRNTTPRCLPIASVSTIRKCVHWSTPVPSQSAPSSSNSEADILITLRFSKS